MTHPVDFSLEGQEIASHPLAAYRADGDWKAGVRPANVIETVKDIEWALDPKHREGAKQVRLVCGFCAVDRAVRSLDEGTRWFRDHKCEAEGIPIEQWDAA